MKYVVTDPRGHGYQVGDIVSCDVEVNFNDRHTNYVCRPVKTASMHRSMYHDYFQFLFSFQLRRKIDSLNTNTKTI